MNTITLARIITGGLTDPSPQPPKLHSHYDSYVANDIYMAICASYQDL